MLSDPKARQITPGARLLAAGGVTGLFLLPSSRRGVVDHLLPGQKGKRQRVEHHPAVASRALPAVCATLFRDERVSTGKLLLEFVILTACRSGEARGMRREEIDAAVGIWTIPASRMKAHTQHRVPVSPRALEILHRMSRTR